MLISFYNVKLIRYTFDVPNAHFDKLCLVSDAKAENIEIQVYVKTVKCRKNQTSVMKWSQIH
jgi:hypothetical protein